MSEAVYDLNAFSLSDVVRCGTRLRQAAAGAADVQDAYRQVVRHLRAEVVDAASGEPGFVLVQLVRLAAGGQARIVAALGDRPEGSLDAARPGPAGVAAGRRARPVGP